MNRRKFIDNAGRGILLGALALVSGVLLSRRQVVQDASCNENFMCRECSKLQRCQLPEAERERKDG